MKFGNGLFETIAGMMEAPKVLAVVKSELSIEFIVFSSFVFLFGYDFDDEIFVQWSAFISLFRQIVVR